jgi:tetratricopeptide (TPR) repeat protein
MIENTAHGDTGSDLLEQANSQIRNHDLDGAQGTLERGLALDSDTEDIVTSLKFVNFWRERESQLEKIQHAFERGEYYISQWPSFEAFAERIGDICEPCMFAVRKHVFGRALEQFQLLVREADTQDSELLMRVGRCHKGLGSYDEAVRYLEAAAAERSDDSEILSELADAYALVNETQAAKAFFREAFFLEPQRVHLELLESQLIRALADKVRELGFSGAALLEWLPVYGVLLGVFTVKRELRSIEYGKLKQGIYALEREIREGRDRDGLIEPRLINRYFWLVDHLISGGEDSAKVDEVLLKLRSVNDRIYKQYTS